MRISDWSSDVCSADLRNDELFELVEFGPAPGAKFLVLRMDVDVAVLAHETHQEPALALAAILATPHLAEIGRAHAELQSLMRISYAVFCLKKKKIKKTKLLPTNLSDTILTSLTLSKQT